METLLDLQPNLLTERLKAEQKQGNLIFAVMDGAHFPDITAFFLEQGFVYEPLYGGEQGRENQIAGPHLLPILTIEQADMLLGLAADKPCLVWWIWPNLGKTTTKLARKQLRSINMVEIPRDRHDSEASEDVEDTQTPDYELVLFRHADANVMASLMPLLTMEQLGRLFGQACTILFHAPEFGDGNQGTRIAPRNPSYPAAHAGFLRITPHQYQALADNSLHQSRLEILAFLRDTAQEETETTSDQQLYQQIVACEAVGHDMGLESNEAHCLYAYIAVTTEGASLESKEIREAIEGGPSSPDDNMRALFAAMIEAAEQDPEDW